MASGSPPVDAQTMPVAVWCPGVTSTLSPSSQASVSVTNSAAVGLGTPPSNAVMAIATIATNTQINYRDDGGQLGLSPVGWGATPFFAGAAPATLLICSGEIQNINFICVSNCPATLSVNWYK